MFYSAEEFNNGDIKLGMDKPLLFFFKVLQKKQDAFTFAYSFNQDGFTFTSESMMHKDYTPQSERKEFDFDKANIY